MPVLDRVADGLLFPRGHGPAPSLEVRDLHELDAILGNEALLDDALTRFERRRAMGLLRVTAPHKIHTIKGMGSVWDYRPFTRANGGVIKPLIFVEHIPVIRQLSGRVDLDLLYRVLVAEGLMVHNGDDAEGNVALYLPLDRLAFHARGANLLSVGTEHMHATIDEPWTDKQLNSSAYLSWRAKEFRDIPHYRARLGAGKGFVTVKRMGHTTHEEEARKAGFNDRSDPGAKYVLLMEEIRQRAIFYGKHKRF